MTPPGPERPTCAAGIAAEDVAAWALDDEPLDEVDDVAAHVRGCEACAAVVASLASVTDVTDLLRRAEATAPAAVAERAIRRVRVEATSMLLLQTIGGAFLRVGRALPELVAGPRRRHAPDDGEDTGELTTFDADAEVLEDTGELDVVAPEAPEPRPVTWRDAGPGGASGGDDELLWGDR